MHPVLEELQRKLVESVEGLTASQTQMRTADDPTRWSVQQIVEHLLLTYGLSAEVFAKRLAKGTATKARASVGQWMGQVVVLRLGRFPQGRQAPSNVLPKDAEVPLSGRELVEPVRTSLERFDALAAQAEAIFGSKQAISHQVLGPLSVAQWRQFHLIHGRHHIKQIQAIQTQYTNLVDKQVKGRKLGV